MRYRLVIFSFLLFFLASWLGYSGLVLSHSSSIPKTPHTLDRNTPNIPDSQKLPFAFGGGLLLACMTAVGWWTIIVLLVVGSAKLPVWITRLVSNSRRVLIFCIIIGFMLFSVLFTKWFQSIAIFLLGASAALLFLLSIGLVEITGFKVREHRKVIVVTVLLLVLPSVSSLFIGNANNRLLHEAYFTRDVLLSLKGAGVVEFYYRASPFALTCIEREVNPHTTGKEPDKFFQDAYFHFLNRCILLWGIILSRLFFLPWLSIACILKWFQRVHGPNQAPELSINKAVNLPIRSSVILWTVLTCIVCELTIAKVLISVQAYPQVSSIAVLTKQMGNQNVIVRLKTVKTLASYPILPETAQTALISCVMYDSNLAVRNWAVTVLQHQFLSVQQTSVMLRGLSTQPRFLQYRIIELCEKPHNPTLYLPN